MHGGDPEITNWSIALNCCEQDPSSLRHRFRLQAACPGRRPELIRDLDPVPYEAFNDLGLQSELGWIVGKNGMRR
jgi:hypothetical protein